MYPGIDIGTSSVKTLLADDKQMTITRTSQGLEVSRPRPVRSEQSPQSWWRAVENCVDEIKLYARSTLMPLL